MNNQREYFVKRVGLRWQVWFKYADGHVGSASGAVAWIGCWHKFFFRRTAERVAIELHSAFNDGFYIGLVRGLRVPCRSEEK